MNYLYTTSVRSHCPTRVVWILIVSEKVVIIVIVVVVLDIEECVQSVEERRSADQKTSAEVGPINVVLRTRTIYASQRNSDDKSAKSL